MKYIRSLVLFAMAMVLALAVAYPSEAASIFFERIVPLASAVGDAIRTYATMAFDMSLKTLIELWGTNRNFARNAMILSGILVAGIVMLACSIYKHRVAIRTLIVRFAKDLLKRLMFLQAIVRLLKFIWRTLRNAPVY